MGSRDNDVSDGKIAPSPLSWINANRPGFDCIWKTGSNRVSVEKSNHEPSTLQI